MTGKTFEWSVVGAGPAGIAAVGKILDSGVEPQSILWIDPFFSVGDLGRFWSTVSSNTSVQLFLDFLKALSAFQYDETSNDFNINQLPRDKTCQLNEIVKPLQWVTDHFVNQVHAVKSSVKEISLHNRLWSLNTGGQHFKAKNVILATGSEPSRLNYSDADVVPFETAINQTLLSDVVDKNKTYGVFGSSHSAIMIIRYLCEMQVKQVINFYRSPCRYAVKLDDWILFDNTGLKGDTARWARNHIDGELPSNLVRYQATPQNIDSHLARCDKVIYAVGFARRQSVNILNYENIEHDPHVGIIGPGLFGLGIGFPELKKDPYGRPELQVGLWKFMKYLNHVFPLWKQYHT